MENGFGYTPVESLLCKTPVIITPCDAFLEIGITNENGFIADWNLDNIDVNELYKRALKVNYKPPESNWKNVLYKGTNTYNKNEKVKMIATRFYTDMQLKKDIECDEPLEVDEVRALELIRAGVAKYE